MSVSRGAGTAPVRRAPGSRAVRYLLDGETMTVSGIAPTRTVLQHLREDLGRTGTKEGCAEGDCGACTVVLVELCGRRLQYRAVNSCIQFLPALDGKALLTVESLGRRQEPDPGALHPVQQALAQSHGTQCGFCTPGFVMSLFALYKTDPAPDRTAITDALAGNLCRCTGYRPIIDAATAMYGLGHAIPAGDQDWLGAPADPGRRPPRPARRHWRRGSAASGAGGASSSGIARAPFTLRGRWPSWRRCVCACRRRGSWPAGRTSDSG